MVPKIITFVIIAIAVALTCGDIVNQNPQPKSNTTVAPSTPTTHLTTTSKPTTTSVTTSSPKTTTTQHTTPSTKPTTPPTEPTTNPPTTTDKPFPHPTTSTPSPTPAPTTPTPKPTPSPKPPQKPDVGKWNVTDHATNVTCILVDMAIQLNISYIGTDNKIKHSIVNVPKNASSNGTCGNSSQILDLEWKQNNKSFGNLTLEFSKNETTKHFMISRIDLEIAADGVFPDISKNDSHIELFSNKSEFSTPVSKSYRCEKEQSFVLKNVDGKNETDSQILVSHVQLEAFHEKKDGKFEAAEDCEPSSSPDIVPIAVGCALVGLVAIVLIAYLVGRRRSQARGYLSM